jgi:hypothetical protein
MSSQNNFGKPGKAVDKLLFTRRVKKLLVYEKRCIKPVSEEIKALAGTLLEELIMPVMKIVTVVRSA